MVEYIVWSQSTDEAEAGKNAEANSFGSDYFAAKAEVEAIQREGNAAWIETVETN